MLASSYWCNPGGDQDVIILPHVLCGIVNAEGCVIADNDLHSG